MSKQQKNSAFVKMLKEFPKVFGRVSFRERLMLRTAFDYINEEVIADIKANCDLAIEGRDIKIKELELELTVEKDLHQEEINLHLHAEEYIKSLEKENAELKQDKKDLIFVRNAKADHINELKDQLTKAKEIIREIMKYEIPTLDYEKAEQFLKEIEKMKDEEMTEECKHYSNNTELQTAYEWGYKNGFLEGLKAGRLQWHDINDKEPSKEQLGKQLLIRMKSVIGNTDYDYLVYKHNGESITDVAGVIAWCEIPTFDKE